MILASPVPACPVFEKRLVHEKRKNAGIVWWLKKNVYLCSPFRQEEGKSLSGGIGRRVGLKHQWGKTRIGSIPISGTKKAS